MGVIREKGNKVKAGLFTNWHGYSHKWRKHNILIIDSCRYIYIIKHQSYNKEWITRY